MLTFEIIQQIICRYFEQQPVTAVYLFGSYARGDASEDSDVDLLLHLDRSGQTSFPFSQWCEELKELLQCEVDLISMPEKKNKGSRLSFLKKITSEQRLLFRQDL